MKKLIEFLGKLLFVSLLIACPLLCGLSIVYRWGEGVIGVFLVFALVLEFPELWVLVDNELKRKE